MKAKLTLENGTEFNVTVDESELKRETSKRWKPEEGTTHWMVNDYGKVISCIYDCVWEEGFSADEWAHSQRNSFKTKEEAEQHLAVLKARATILDHADEVNEGWVPDWSNYRSKYYIEYDHSLIIYGENRLIVTENYRRQHVGCIYYKTKQDALKAINKVGDAYLTLLGVEK